MLKATSIAAILAICCFFQQGMCYLEVDGWISITLHHNLGSKNNGNEFSYRGNITIPSLNSGLSNTIQDTLSDAQREILKVMAKQNDIYRLQATVTYANGIKDTFLTSNKACSLFLAQLTDVLWISIDHTGFVTAITQAISTSSSGCSDLNLSVSELDDFNTDVLIRHTESAPIPDTASFIQKIEREREARERGEVRDNRGFFAKYWMYIVPAVLLVFISGATNQEAAK